MNLPCCCLLVYSLCWGSLWTALWIIADMMEQVKAGVTNSNDQRSKSGDSCSLFLSVLFSLRELQPSPVLVAWVHVSSLYPCPSLNAEPYSFTLFVSHCLFFCPRLNSLTHSSESSPPTTITTTPLTRLLWWPKGSELGGGLCMSACVCMLQCLRQIRSEVRVCDLPDHHSYLGQGVHTLTLICHSYVLFMPPPMNFLVFL